MKKNFKMHPGFTLAELLISLLTVSLIATALVPIIGPKKITNPDPKYLHGIAECYWDGDTLMYYYADSKSNREGRLEEAGEYCTFKPPKAAHIEVYAIGAGSNGVSDADQLWTNINDTTATFQGNISLENWQYDTNGAIANIVGNRRFSLVDNNGTDFVTTVRDAFTRWAIALNYNYFNRWNGTVFDNTDTFNNPSDWPYMENGRYLYAEFRGLRGPIGKAGNGYSEAKIVPGSFPFDDDTCEMRCVNFTNPKCSLQEKLSGPNAPWWLARITQVINGVPQNDESDAITTAMEHNNCYFYLNYVGGNSDEPIRVNDVNTPVLFPIDGTSTIVLEEGSPMLDRGLGPTNYSPPGGNSQLVINIRARGADSNRLLLKSSAPGTNATNTSDGMSVQNGNLGVYASASVRFMGTNKPKYGVNGTNLDSSHFGRYDDNPNGVRNGMKHGLLYGLGGILEPEIQGMPGNLGIARPGDAFTWRYIEPKVDIRYGHAGIPGQIEVLSFPRLRNNLYLKPGRNHDGIISNTFVSLTEGGPSPRILLSAESPSDATELENTNNGYVIDNYAIAESNNAAVPPERILNKAMPENWKLAKYINKMRSLAAHGIKGGLYTDCIENNLCPGFGGAGAYPLLINQLYQNRLTITNNQPYADLPGFSEFKTYMRVFESNEINIPECANGYNNPNAGNENDGVLHYCTSENPVRRDGAVIIVW